MYVRRWWLQHWPDAKQGRQNTATHVFVCLQQVSKWSWLQLAMTVLICNCAPVVCQARPVRRTRTHTHTHAHICIEIEWNMFKY